MNKKNAGTRRNLRNLRRTRKNRARPSAAIPDRRVFDPPKNLRVAVGTIADPYGIPEPAQKVPKRRRDGSSSAGEGEWYSPGQPQIVVLRSIRTDPLGWMHSHSQIDEAEYLAGRRWQSLYERSHVGSVQAIDTSKEPVDGGRFSEPMTDSQRVAIDQLRLAGNALLASAEDRARGVGRMQLIRDVLATGLFIKMAAAARGITAERAIGALAKEFRASLGVLAEHFGFVGVRLVSGGFSKTRGWRKPNEESKDHEEEDSSQGQDQAA